jgi:FtsP/CotA-like multicopper oxidase with cupredoxin domain
VDTALKHRPSGDQTQIRRLRHVIAIQYLLINGKAFPGTAPFAVAPDDIVLLRYVNAGLQAHSLSTLGLSQTIIAQDGSPYTFSHKVVAETIATGKTLDTLVTIPASAADGTKFAVYEANMLLRNNSGSSAFSGVGGMLTFLTVGTPPPPDQIPSVHCFHP